MVNERDPMDPRNQSPFNVLPPTVVALAIIILGIELIFQAGALGLAGGQQGPGWRITTLEQWSVSEVVWDWMFDTRSAPLDQLARFLTYPLLHGSLIEAGFVAVFVLAFGNAIAPVYDTWRFLLIFFGASIDGALAYLIFFDSPVPLFGGFPGAYGLIGAFTYLTLRGLTRADPSKAFVLLGFLIAIQPVFAIVTLSGLSFVPRWIAEIAGAATGYALAMILFPGAIAGFRDRMRQR
ncbi:rhomboid family intramembrane serine protease [Jannaschia pohangensis]|nr:rhomboid family intramembrane serine protease [Jannaschia pohangensis]